jgi:hypothetical protein
VPGRSVGWNLDGAEPNVSVEISWQAAGGQPVSLGTAVTDQNGDAAGSFVVPDAPGGPGYQIVIVAGDDTETIDFEIAPRLSVNPTNVLPGQAVTLDLRGFAANDTLRVRWRIAGAWVHIGSVTMDASGTLVGATVTVPLDVDAGPNSIRVDGAINQQTNAVTVLSPSVTIDPVVATVNGTIAYSLVQFPPNSAVSISWRRLSGSTIDLGTVMTDGSGSATGEITVPATPGGTGQIVTFSSGGTSRQVSLEVKPRVKVTSSPAGRGDTIDISLRGFAKQEAVTIRWRAGTSGPFQTIASGQTSNTGSANIAFTIPASAADGTYQVRAESVSFNQQTNVFEVQGGIQLASERSGMAFANLVTETPAHRSLPDPVPGVNDPAAVKPEEGSEPEPDPEGEDPPDEA